MTTSELVLVTFTRTAIRALSVKIVCPILVNDTCESKLSKIEVG